MRTQQSKTLITNIVTGMIILGFFGVGYWFFVKKQGETNGEATTSVEERATQTIVAGTDMARTIKDLNELNVAIRNSRDFFDVQAFQSLQDFSVTIPEEPIGRENPFTLPDWKVAMDALVAH